MKKEIGEMLARNASDFQLAVMQTLQQEGVTFKDRIIIFNKLQQVITEFLESLDLDIGLIPTLAKPEDKDKQKDEKTELIGKVRRAIDKYNLSYASAAKRLGIASGPLYNWLNGKTLPSRTSFNKLKDAYKNLIAELSVRKNEHNTEHSGSKEEDIAF